MAPKESIMKKFLYKEKVDFAAVKLTKPTLDLDIKQASSDSTVLLSTRPTNIDVVDLDARNLLEEKPALTSFAGAVDIVILNAAAAALAYEEARAKQARYKANCQWQDTKAACMPWAESVVGADGKIHQVCCKICTEVEGREKLLVPKLDSFLETLWVVEGSFIFWKGEGRGI